MPVKQQKFNVRISKKLGPEIRRAMAKEIIDRIIERTGEGKGKNNKKWTGEAAKYSAQYKNSLDFKIGGKSKGGPVNLRLSSEMLESLQLLKHTKGQLTIGYKKGDKRNNAVAHGNITGSYGKKRGNKAKARDFLGISDKELSKIKRNYPLDDIRLSVERAKLIKEASETGKKVVAGIILDDGEDIDGN